MKLQSGGLKFRWRRKRGKAARLHPVAEDADSTTSLFNGNGRARHHGRARSLGEPPAARPVPEPNPATPLLRYEWRSPDGETLVVEAGWPAAEGMAEPELTVLQAGGTQPTALEQAGFERPRFKAPARSGRVSSLDLRG